MACGLPGMVFHGLAERTLGMSASRFTAAFGFEPNLPAGPAFARRLAAKGELAGQGKRAAGRLSECEQAAGSAERPRGMGFVTARWEGIETLDLSEAWLSGRRRRSGGGANAEGAD